MKSIQRTTPVPGPRSRALAKRSADAVARGVSQITPIFVERASGAVIEDVDGNHFIDLAGGIGCLNVGQRDADVVSAIHAQADRFLHTCFMVTPYESYIRLAERLNQLAPGRTPKKTIILNSGAEAVENGIKIARAYTKRPAVICFEDGFHGRTLLALSLTSKTVPYKAGFEPFASDIYRVPYAYCYRCSYSLTYPGCKLHCAHHLEDTFKRVVAAESVAAIIAEPILGEGGFVPPPPEWLSTIREICDRHGILLIADEVQTGIGRTGKMFACDYTGVEPDLLLTAKSLGGGLPIAAVTGKANIMDHTGPGSLGGTFGGNPLACEAALAALDAIDRGRLCERAEALGNRFRRRALQWQRQFVELGDVRGVGAMQAIELVSGDGSKTPNPGLTKALATYCYENGVILVTAGTYGNVIRILMPLVITDAQMDEAMDAMEAGLMQLLRGAAQAAASEMPVGVV